jgi:hypothetical protein
MYIQRTSSAYTRFGLPEIVGTSVVATVACRCRCEWESLFSFDVVLGDFNTCRDDWILLPSRLLRTSPGSTMRATIAESEPKYLSSGRCFADDGDRA